MSLVQILKEATSNKKIETLLSDYVDLNLECDGMTRVISYILKQNKIAHTACIGYISYKNKGIDHMWIKLTNGDYIDYRAQMWLGKSKDVPNGVFNPKDYPNVNYECDKQVKLNVSNMIFNILAME